ncbi:hypothetical protein BJV74DRAFT_847467, partial [Russula compacta]
MAVLSLTYSPAFLPVYYSRSHGDRKGIWEGPSIHRAKFPSSPPSPSQADFSRAQRSGALGICLKIL